MEFDVRKWVLSEVSCLFLHVAFHGLGTCKGRCEDVWPCREHAIQPKARQGA